MRNLFIIMIITCVPGLTHAQRKVEKLNKYLASNGITYKVGDEIKLGRGSGNNGDFVYLRFGGWYGATDTNPQLVNSASSGLVLVIKKIKRYDYKRFKGVYFTVGGGNITNYLLDIENAVSTCEVENCIKDNKVNIPSSGDKYNRIAKLKELLDAGAITKEEFELEKKKILNDN